MTFKCRSIRILLVFLCLASSSNLQAEKKVLDVPDFDRWRTIRSASISAKGDWVAFVYRQREKDNELHIKNPTTGKDYKIMQASRPVISDDSRWAAYLVSPKAAEMKKLRKEKKPVPTKVELIDLKTGKKVNWDNANSFTFAKGSGYLVVKKAKANKTAKHKGTDLIFRNLQEGHEELLGSVNEFAFNKPGTILAYTVDTHDKNGNGLYLIDLKTGRRLPLDNDKAEYSRLTWDEEGFVLAVLKGNEKKDFLQKENRLLAFTDLKLEHPKRYELKSTEAFKFPKNYVISEKGALSWSSKRDRVFFGIKEQVKKTEKKKDADPVANLDIWHWKDKRIQSVQMIQANRDKNRTFQSVFLLKTKRFVQLTDKSMTRIGLTRDGKWGVGEDARKYIHDWKVPRADFYKVEIATGKRTLMFKGRPSRSTHTISPDGKHFVFWKDVQFWDYQLDTGKTVNLTKVAPISFENAQFDHFGEKPPYGVAGWSKNKSSVLLYSEFDLWKQPFDGSKAICLTNNEGAKREITFRYQRTDTDEKFIDLSKPMLMSAFGKWTKKDGFYELADGKLRELIYEDKRFGRISKARQAAKYLFTTETFEDFPDEYVSDVKFTSPKRVSDANPQQLEYRWGHRILFDYTNSKGIKLQGTLAIPDGYQKGQKLPMLVNFYEKYSQNLHRYYTPSFRSGPQFSRFVSNGYLVMQPDIYFNTRTSHSDMLECVEAAVKKVIQLGYADPKRVGLHGHSYSGQGAAFISTRSKMFAAVLAGAAATDLISDFNQIWKNAGTNQHRYDIYGQGRFATNPYDDLDLFMHESAVFHVRDMNTPLLLLHGTADGAVEWLQAIEFYNALRFNGKNVILLSYPGERHGLRKFENQKDFQTRMNQFFDHYLKGKPAPQWMTHGVPFLKKKK